MENAALHLPEDFLDGFVGAGSKVPAVTVDVDRPLLPEDVAEYLQAAGGMETSQKSDQKDLAVLRARHHSVARLLATGMPEGIVAELSGYTASYLSTLKNNPAMIELINHYRAPQNDAAANITEKLRLVGDAALNRIIEELPNMDHQALLGAAKLGTDRSGNGPQTKVNHEHTHGLDQNMVKALAESARRRNDERIIDVASVRQLLPSAKTEGEDNAG